MSYYMTLTQEDLDELLIKHYEYLNSNGKLGSLLYLVDYYLSNLNFYKFRLK